MAFQVCPSIATEGSNRSNPHVAEEVAKRKLDSECNKDYESELVNTSKKFTMVHVAYLAALQLIRVSVFKSGKLAIAKRLRVR